MIPLLSLAQEYSLSGKVIGADNIPIPYSDVVLQDKDSVVVQWELTDEDGKYTIENINPALYTLKISIVGYATKKIEIVIDKDITEQTTVLEQEVNALDEVVVAKRRVERRSDGIVFNVQNTPLADGDSWNALTRTPQLMITGDKILVRGRETPLVFINDRRVYLSPREFKQFLESTPANLLKSIEVITSPPAKYDAEGKAVVNIVMNKNPIVGYNGNARAAYEQGGFPKYVFSSGHFYKTGKVNLYARYNYNYEKEHEFFEDRLSFFTEGNPSGSWYSETWRIEKRPSHTLQTNLDYDISDDHSLGLSGFFNVVPNKKDFYNSNTEAIDSSFTSINRGIYKRNNFALSLDYKYTIGNGKELAANIHHNNYNYDHDQNITTDYWDSDQSFIRNNAFTNDKEQYVEIYTGQLDYSSDTEQSGTFETGVKWSYITFDNRIDQVNIAGENIDLYDRFLYDETTFAAYLSYEKNWEYWNIRLGVRGENTNLKGVSLSESQTNEQDYFKLFPSVNIGYNPSENHNFTLSYSRKISRPEFKSLNPFRLFSNDNTYVTGNPGLLPTINTRLIFGYTLNQAFNFELYFSRAANPILLLPYVDNEGSKLIYRRDNLDKSTEYGLDISWNKDVTPWWYLSLSSSVFYDEDFFFATQNDNEVLGIDKWVTIQRITNSFTFTKTFTGDIEFAYQSRSPMGNTTISALSMLNLGLRKTLWKKRATLSFYANDIFNQLAPGSNANYLDQRISNYSDFENRTFELIFIYRFGNYRLRTNRKSINNEEKDRL